MSSAKQSRWSSRISAQVHDLMDRVAALESTAKDYEVRLHAASVRHFTPGMRVQSSKNLLSSLVGTVVARPTGWQEKFVWVVWDGGASPYGAYPYNLKEVG